MSHVSSVEENLSRSFAHEPSTARAGAVTPAAPRRRRRRLLLGVVAAVLAVAIGVAWATAGGGDVDCPANRVTAQVAEATPRVLTPPAPLDPSGTTYYRLEVTFEVTNPTPVAADVYGVHVPIVGYHDVPVVANIGGDRLGPGQALTATGFADVAGSSSPAPDPERLRVEARWADVDYANCPP